MKIKDYVPTPIPEANVERWEFKRDTWRGLNTENTAVITVTEYILNKYLQGSDIIEYPVNLAVRNGWPWGKIITKAFNLSPSPIDTRYFGSLKVTPKKKESAASDQSPSVTSPKIRCPQIADRLVDTPRPFKGKPWRDIYRKDPHGEFYGWTCDVPTHNGTTIVWAKHLPYIQELNAKPGYYDMITQCFFEPPPSEPMHKAVVPGPHGDAEYAELEMVAARVTQGVVKPRCK